MVSGIAGSLFSAVMLEIWSSTIFVTIFVPQGRHLTGGLAARAIEAAGIPTVSISIVREVTEKTPPPRALYLRFPFGHALGEAGKTDQQFTILFRALHLLFEAEHPGTIDNAGLRWKKEVYAPPDWDAFRQLGPCTREEGKGSGND